MWKLSVLLLISIFFTACWGKAFEITADDKQHQQDLESKIGPKECAKGTKYWCQDIRTAKKCGAVRHCIQTVWEYKKLPADNNEICETCKTMVQQARDELQKNTTQELIKEVLEGTCDIYFPIRIIAKECEKLVDEFIPEFIEILTSRMDPQVVCSLAWLCNSNKLHGLIGDINIVVEKTTAVIPTSVGSDVCEDCKNFAAEAIQKLKDMGQSEFSSRLIKFCDSLSGALYTLCRMTAESKSGEIYTYLITDLKPDEACALAAMCVDGLDPIDKKVKKPVVSLKKPSADPECELCIQLTTRLRDIIVANSTREEVKDVLLNICSHLKTYKDECTNYVSNYFNEVYDFLINELDPKLVCQVFGMCVTKRRLIGGDDAASFGKIHSNKIPNITVKVPFSKPQPHKPVTSAADCQVNNKVYCVVCEYAMHEIQNLLQDNKSEAAIENALEKVCSLLPQTVVDECDAFIEQYGPAIFSLLAQELDPSLICTELGLCDSTKGSPIQSLNSKTMERLTSPDKLQLPIDRMVPTNKNLEGKEECLYCQYSMELVHSVLSMNGTKEAIVYGLDDVCHTLPTTWRNTCDSFIELYAESFLTLLQQQNLSEVCSILSICSGNVGVSMYEVAVKAAEAAVNHTSSDTCSICEVTVQMLSRLLNNPTISADVVKAIQEVCLVVPKTSRPKCQSIIQLYGPYFIKMVAEFTDPKHVCQMMKLCDPPLGQVNLLGGNKCTYGPSYWCKSKVHAKACGAVEHCKNFVWKS